MKNRLIWGAVMALSAGIIAIPVAAEAGPKRNEMVWICTNERVAGSKTMYRRVTAKIFRYREYENAAGQFFDGATLGKCPIDNHGK